MGGQGSPKQRLPFQDSPSLTPPLRALPLSHLMSTSDLALPVSPPVAVPHSLARVRLRRSSTRGSSCIRERIDLSRLVCVLHLSYIHAPHLPLLFLSCSSSLSTTPGEKFDRLFPFFYYDIIRFFTRHSGQSYRRYQREPLSNTLDNTKFRTKLTSPIPSLHQTTASTKAKVKMQFTTAALAVMAGVASGMLIQSNNAYC